MVKLIDLDVDGTLVNRKDWFPKKFSMQFMRRFVETNGPEANKGNTLKMLADLLHIPLLETVACGDAIADASMLRIAGFSIAMGSAHPDLKPLAKFVAPQRLSRSGLGDSENDRPLNIFFREYPVVAVSSKGLTTGWGGKEEHFYDRITGNAERLHVSTRGCRFTRDRDRPRN